MGNRRQRPGIGLGTVPVGAVSVPVADVDANGSAYLMTAAIGALLSLVVSSSWATVRAPSSGAARGEET